MNDAFQILAGLCLLIITLALIFAPFLILAKLEQIRTLLKTMDDRAAMQEYKNQRKTAADPE